MKLLLCLVFLISSIGFSFPSTSNCNNNLINLLDIINWDREIQTPFVKELISHEYNENLKNSINIIKMIKELPLEEQKIVCYRALFNEIEGSFDEFTPEHLAFIYNIQKDFGKFFNDEDFEYIKNRTPPIIWNFPFFNQTTYIKNRNMPVYLTVEKRFLERKYRLIAQGSLKPVDGYSQFILIPNELGTAFRIYNSVHQSYLFSVQDRIDRNNRYAMMWLDPQNLPDQREGIIFGDEWIFKPHLYSNFDFSIKNVFWNEYLTYRNEPSQQYSTEAVTINPIDLIYTGYNINRTLWYFA